MSDISIFYATRDGQSERIAGRIAARIRSETLDVGLRKLPAEVAAGARVVVVVAAVRYGRHLPEAVAFLEAYAGRTDAPPLALASVNLTARKPNRRATDNPYLRKLIERTKVAPVLSQAFAGALDYPRYRLFDRLMIQFIMALTGGPTDGVSSVEFTDWDQVDAFADAIVAQYAGRRAN